ETCYKDVCKTVCEPVTTCKMVSKRVPVTSCENYCVPGRTTTRRVKQPDTCCFDPCTCQTYTKPGGWVNCTVKEPDQMRTRQVTTYQTVCESVPTTTMCRKTVTERVPVTVCKKVPVTEVKKVPYTCTRMVTETQVKKVPYTVTRMVTETHVK